MRALLLLLLLPALAGAGHHRGHAIGFLVDASDEIAAAQVQLALFSAQLEVADSSRDEATLRSFIQQAEVKLALASEQLVDSLDNLSEPDTDRLKITRRILNAPNDTTPTSMSGNLQAAMQYMAGTAGAEPAANRGYAMRALSLAWKLTDRAAWHVDDAIREEIYLDPEFQ